MPAEGHVLGDIEPVFEGKLEPLFPSYRRYLQEPLPRSHLIHSHSPEVEIVDAALDIAHVDVKGEEVDGSEGAAREHLEEIRQAVAGPAGVGRGTARVHHPGGRHQCAGGGGVGGGGGDVVVALAIVVELCSEVDSWRSRDGDTRANQWPEMRPQFPSTTMPTTFQNLAHATQPAP